MIRLLIFDLDGTLVDSAPDIMTAVNTLMHQRGRAPLPRGTIVAAIGEGLRQLIFDLFPETHANPEAIRQLEHDFYSLYERHLLDSTEVFPGVTSFLDSCEKRIAIVTNKHEALARRVVDGLGLKRYPWLRLFGADSLSNKKPDPLPLHEVMRAAGVDRSETLMIGDGIPDMIAARRAGVHSIAIEFGYTPIDILKAQGASLVLSSFDRLHDVIATAETLSPREISSA